ncbi:MAG: hypothetical protein GXN93_03095 [Candidatus Diapherotrites archaeon]|nr:hypothetical protein [Candidatus Diapherotrites archaeon]
MSYELIIVFFVVLAGLLLIDLQWTFLYQPLVELAIFLGLVTAIVGVVKRDYDVLFTGIVFFIGGLAMLSAMGTYVPATNATKQGLVWNILWPILAPFGWLYGYGPLAVGLGLIFLAWILSRIG